jgi:phage shock protein PspC (stress-responsive transcriptional regulator)
MNKTIIININSIVFHIEEDAYEILRSYIAEIKKHFSQTPDSEEILQDIENRIAEMFSERIHSGKKEVISSNDVNEVIAQMGRVSDFEEIDDTQTPPQEEEAKDEKKTAFKNKKLMRNPDDTMIGGVCSGLAYYFGLEAVWVRIIFVLVFLFMGSGILIYLVLWAIMPAASSRADRMAMRGEEPNLHNMMKNFQEEFKDYNEGFNKVTNQIAKGAGNLGPAIGKFFKLIGKLLAMLMLFVCGMVIFGMLGTWIGFATGILGYQSEMVFPGTEMFPVGQALIALSAGILAITIPFMVLFYIFFRIIFKTGPMNTYLSLSLWATWIVSIIFVLFYVFVGVQEFKEKSTISLERQLEPKEIYHFSEKDLRVLNASTETRENKRFIHVETNGEDLSAHLKGDISINFESLDSLETPFIQYKYSAKGKNRQVATERASNIHYLAQQEDNKIIFDSHFSLPNADMFRDQSVSATIHLPIGAKVVIEESIRHKMWGIAYSACKNSYAEEDKKRETEWLMKRSGLVCAPFHIEQKKKEEVEATDE